MSSLRLLRFVIVFAFCVITSVTCDAKKYYVRMSGSDKNTGTKAQDAFRTIQKAASTADKGDVIYIGAGTYDESVVFDARSKKKSNNGSDKGKKVGWRSERKRPSHFGGWTIMQGDTAGTYTGDRGTVTIRPQGDSFGIQAIGVDNLLIQEITFTNGTDQNQVYYGCMAMDTTGEIIIDQCRFLNLAYGVYNRGSNILALESCETIGGNYGLYSEQSDTVSVINSKYMASQHSVVSFDAGSTEIEQTEFTATNPATGESVNSNAIYAARTALDARDCQFAGSQRGVYGSELIRMDMGGCKFLNTTDHAVDCSGVSLAMQDCIIQDGNYGVTLSDTSGNESLIENTTIEAMSIGLQAVDSDYQLKNVSIKGNQFGFYQRSGCQRISLSESDTVNFAENQYAMVAIHGADEDAVLNISGQDFRDNAAAIYVRHTRVQLDDSQFGGDGWGACFYDSRSVDVTNCQFNGNPTNPADYLFGIYARSNDIDLRDTTSENARYGIIVDNTDQRAPILKGVKSQNHTFTALYIRNGNWTYTASDNNHFGSSPRGVMAVKINWKVVDVDMDGSCEYPLMDYYGRCEITNATLRAEKTGVYSYQSETLHASQVRATQCGEYGFYVYDCAGAMIDQCSATDCSSGIYVNDPDGQFVSIMNSQFTGNHNYGVLLVDTGLNPNTPTNLNISDNRYGLCVHHRPLILNRAMNVQISGNNFGVVSYRDSLALNEIELLNNGVGAYVEDSSVAIDSVTIDAASFGLLGHPAEKCEITKSEFKNAAYGIRLELRNQLADAVSFSEVNVNHAGTCGIYISDDTQLVNRLDVRNSVVADSEYGMIADGTSVVAHQLSLKGIAEYGFYQSRGSCSLAKCQISSNSWAVVSFGDRCDLVDTSCSTQLYGVAMLAQSGSMVNSTVTSTSYGLYLNRVDAHYRVIQSTIAVREAIGLLRENGDAIVQNSIITAATDAMYDLKLSGTLTNDHNLVYASNRPYNDVSPGEGDINKHPIFVDQTAGDLRLAAGSPAINAGRDLSGLVTTDILGNTRPSFRAYEIGAFEYMEPSGSLRVLKWDEVAR